MEEDILFMQRAMELARRGLGSVSPNPQVGCVIVANGRIIGEGWHKQFGGPHAEVNALASITDDSLLSQATVYVNLEPCSHVGKTPPCVDKLIQSKVRRVVVANRDTNPLVAGQGMKKLHAAGIEVTEGVLESEGRRLNRRFFALIEQGIPYVILKWAESADGFIAGKGRTRTWISNRLSQQRVHQWRTEEDAVMVGTNTAMIDNPQLNVRDWSGRNPVRIVIDRTLRLPSTLNLFDKSQPTICYNLSKDAQQGNLSLVRLNDENFFSELLYDLQRRNMGSLIVEGGAQTLSTFIAGGWWHEARIFLSANSLGGGILAPLLRGQLISEDEISGDRLSCIENPMRTKM